MQRSKPRRGFSMSAALTLVDHDLLVDAAGAPASLGEAPRGFRGRIRALRAEDAGGGLPPDELERRLVEMGFVEGVIVELLHQGPFGRDPIAVRVDGATVALRRREARAVLVAPAG